MGGLANTFEDARYAGKESVVGLRKIDGEEEAGYIDAASLTDVEELVLLSQFLVFSF